MRIHRIYSRVKGLGEILGRMHWAYSKGLGIRRESREDTQGIF